MYTVLKGFVAAIFFTLDLSINKIITVLHQVQNYKQSPPCVALHQCFFIDLFANLYPLSTL